VERKHFLSVLRRPLAEVLIIVTGVLIALAANNWSAERADRRSEQAYLRSLSDDLAQDIAQLDTAMSVIRRRQESAWSALRTVRDNRVVTDTAALVRQLSDASLLWNYRPIAHTFEDLKSTGNLQLLHDREIRRGISDYYNVLFLAFDDWIQESFWTRFRPLLFTYLNAADVASQLYADDARPESLTNEDVVLVPRVDISGLRGDAAVGRALEMNILTMSQQLTMLARQREKGTRLRTVLESALK
jgi:hypothetical protein